MKKVIAMFICAASMACVSVSAQDIYHTAAGAQGREARLFAHFVGGLEERPQPELRHQNAVVELHHRHAGGSMVNILC